MIAKLKKALSLLLVALMVISLMPTLALASADEGEDSGYYRIVHLDCGRKYFSADWIKALITEMAADGYNQLQLAFGNDGLRFLLDDMSFSANGTNYSNETVVSKVEAGNAAQNESGDGRYLTQTEMDGIIAHANASGIEIVPLLNLPGHANAILDIADDAYNASGSNNTLNVASSDAAQEFGLAIFKKYVDYFAEKGCRFFNFGADEYANDASGTFSFSRLSSAEYAKFVEFINSLAAYIKEKGMTPRSFNDGLYYNNQSADIDTDIQCCYWSCGWGSYPVASASTIAGKGHGMINTNGDYYYVLGKSDTFDSGYSSAASFSNTAFMGSTISDPKGSMFCIWCDYPNAETETEVAQKTRLVLRAMANRMRGESIDSISTDVVPGGFNADGTINVTESSVTVRDTAASVSVSAPGLTSVTVGKVEQPAYTEGAAVVGYDITPYVGDSAYTGGATVSITVPEELTDYDTLGVYDAEQSKWLTSTVSEGVISFTAEHFSEYDIVALDSGAAVDVALSIGGTKTFDGITASAGDYITGSEQYLATAKVTTTAAPDTFTRVTTLAAGTYYVSASSNDSAPTTQLTLEEADDGYYLKNASGAYIYPNGSRFFGWSYSCDSGEATAVTVASSGSGFTFSRSVTSGYVGSETKTVYLTLSRGTFGASETSTTLYLYTKTKAESSTSSLTITGVGEGAKTVTIGGVTYNINVTAPTTTQSKTLNCGASYTLPDSAVDAKITSGEGVVSLSGNTVTAGDSAGSAVVTYVTKNAGGYVTARYTVNITVIAEDLSTVTGLTVEYWITNARVVADGAQSKTINASDPGVYGESGALFSTLVPATGTKYSSGEAMVFWKGTRLASNNKQTGNSGVDKTRSGNDFTYVRYFDGNWAYSADRVTWTNFASGDQIVAYYLQVTDVTDEVTTQVVDWGPQKSDWSSLDYLYSNYVLVDYSVKYESGTESPSSFPTSKTLAFHCKDTGLSNNGTAYRRIGMVRGVETSDYEVYMITLTPTADKASTTLSGSYASSNTSYSYNGTEVVAWAKTQEDLDNSGLGTYTSISGTFTHSIGGEPIVSGLEIYKQHGVKVTYYVRARATEDSLTVHYIDSTVNPNIEFYNYNIVVDSGVLFDESIALDNPWKGPLVNGTVINSLGVAQTVSADLNTMPDIGAQYRHSDYTCVRVERSEDGKDVYLYYTFNNIVSFVVDYGLAVTIAPADINTTLVASSITSVTVSRATYGTLTVNEGTKAITYTPTKLLNGVDSFDVAYTGTTAAGTSDTIRYKVYIYPATTVYYEDSFITVTNGKGVASAAVWSTDGTAQSAEQALAKLGSDSNVYGYDAAYDSCTTFSMGSAQKVTVTKAMADGWTDNSAWPVASFTFKGTGFDVISLTNSDSGAIFVTVKKDGAEVKNLVVNNYYGYDYVDGEWVIDENSTEALYQVPVMKVSGLDYGEYTVEIRPAYYWLFDQTGDSAYSFWLDAVRVYDPAGPDNDSYKNDGEYKPSYQKIKSILVNAGTFSEGGQINGVVFIDGMPDCADVADYANYGPNNETYLANGQAVAFKLIATAQPAEVQIGVKLALGDSAALAGSLTNTLTTATDMYYSLSGLTWTQQNGKYVSSVITVANTTSGSIVSLTNIKITGGAQLTTLEAVQQSESGDELAAAFVDAYTLDEAVKLLSEEPEPELPEVPAEPITPAPDAGLEPIERPEGEWENPFNDVAEDAWYYEFVKSVAENGLMNGTGEGFDPSGKLTRAMLVTVLYRMSGSDPVEPTHKFDDVDSALWYAEGIAWGYANGVISGYSDSEFAPNKYVSRQEMAAMIARYAKLCGMELTGEFLTLFNDDSDIADYAREAVYGLREKGILSGRDGNVFDPNGTATRAETAKVIALLSAF